MPRKRLAPIKPALLTRARVAGLADALASGASDRKVVEVRVLSRAPFSPRCRFARDWPVATKSVTVFPQRVLQQFRGVPMLPNFSVLGFPAWQPHVSVLTGAYANETIALR